jgi:hypothetical protein
MERGDRGAPRGRRPGALAKGQAAKAKLERAGTLVGAAEAKKK